MRRVVFRPISNGIEVALLEPRHVLDQLHPEEGRMDFPSKDVAKPWPLQVP